MYLFYFNPNDYGEQAFVCAENEEAAKTAVQKLYENKIAELLETYDEDIATHIEKCHREHMDNMINLKNGYTLEKLEPGQAMRTEIS